MARDWDYFEDNNRKNWDSEYSPPQCGFCNNKTTRKMSSKEHIWPQWMHERLENESKIEKPTGTTSRDFVTRSTSNELPAYERNKINIGGPWRKTIRSLCRPCNNGWASQIQTNSKESLRNLMDGGLIISEKDQDDLRTWFSMFSYNADFYDNQGLMITQATRSNFRETQQNPPEFRFWIARNGTVISNCAHNHVTQSQTVYFGGYNHDGTINYNTDWRIFRIVHESVTVAVIGSAILFGYTYELLRTDIDNYTREFAFDQHPIMRKFHEITDSRPQINLMFKPSIKEQALHHATCLFVHENNRKSILRLDHMAPDYLSNQSLI
ncbi:hypothetical protein [Sphingomonas sanxanigenens]|uniref:hypothetical protein n=1 Tax=Sphingomonas sanxanigenens TaxID=397260 RepID=UPI00138F4110|nr:hypothetical protein [Sphingomonas sanxanigenens]